VIRFQYSCENFHELLPSLAKTLETKAANNAIVVPPSVGKGYIWSFSNAENLNILVADTNLHQAIEMQHHSTISQLYILSFVEQESSDNNIDDAVRKVNLYNAQVEVTHTLPAGKHTRLIMIVFEKKHLLQVLPSEVVEAILSKYFSGVLLKPTVEPIDTAYRVIIDELIKEEGTHPLRPQFISNRIMMLIETFLRKHFKKNDSNTVSFSDDEISRLMKVESLLVKDFGTLPPTIDRLSRISAMSPTKLKKDFKALYGQPIYEYFQKNRMLEAKSLLLTGKYSIKEVGTRVGYINLSHFAAGFKKEFGLLPSEMTAHKNN
jgi:AraC-like DNA-binding protein